VKGGLAVAAILLLAGCDRMVSKEPAQVYGPGEEGLTLVYADPSQPAQPRLQMRVAKVESTAEGRRVTETWSNVNGQMEITILQREGGVSIAPPGREPFMVLPPGFPDRTTSWIARGRLGRVIGRSRVDLPGVDLPQGPLEGVWVEILPLDEAGTARRALYVPDIGEVESLEWRKGDWIPVNRLVSRGFTDLPVSRSQP
jgi:hypothetical protein